VRNAFYPLTDEGFGNNVTPNWSGETYPNWNAATGATGLLLRDLGRAPRDAEFLDVTPGRQPLEKEASRQMRGTRQRSSNVTGRR
jgi:hypothetical protein